MISEVTNILVGTSGYFYSDWKGCFYPSQCPQRLYLVHYARHFPVLELNVTFYRMPSAQLMAGMVKRTESRLPVTVKMHRSITHETGASATMVRRFMTGILPLREAGVLQAVLLQFPYSFHETFSNRKYLDKLLKELQQVQVAVEFRNKTWFRSDILHHYRGEGIAICGLDQPDLPDLPGFVRGAHGSIAYFRFHGRRKDTWWQHKHPWERYDYMYQEEELKRWIPILRSTASDVSRVFVFFNNHYRGQAIRNAQMMMAFLAEDL